jgi:hypothetical protein
MTNFGPLLRCAALAGLIASAAMSVAPAFAGPAEDAVLAQYVGEWKGRGQLVGARSETLVCRLDMTKGTQGKINYNGRCSVAGAAMSVAGTMAYIDANRRYEAVMSSSVAFDGSAVGRKQGSGIVFNLEERNKLEGADVAINAQIALQDGAINVSFTMVDVATGGQTSAAIPFSK